MRYKHKCGLFGPVPLMDEMSVCTQMKFNYLCHVMLIFTQYSNDAIIIHYNVIITKDFYQFLDYTLILLVKQGYVLTIRLR